jgi:CubicO group peptidase (beta-lactamase class C family)
MKFVLNHIIAVYLKLIIFLALLLIGKTAYSQPETIQTNNPTSMQAIQVLDARLDSILERNSIPGAAVAIVSRDSIVWIGCYGYADLESREPVTENTHFRIGSCTKSFTGLGFLKLIDEGRIDINAPVSQIIPEIEIDNPWHDTHPVRVIHLLEHTSGFEDSHLNWFYLDGPAKSLRQALEEKANLFKVRWPPGTRVSYSSPGYTLAGYILEKVSGQPFDEYIRQKILQPIGMATSTIGRASDKMDLLAIGYGDDNEPFPYYYDYDEPAGAMNASIKEMALFEKFMLNRGKADDRQVIDEDLFGLAGTSSTTLAAQAGITTGYGYGVSSGFRENRRWYGHAGAVPGFYADYTYYPGCRLGYVVLLNEFGKYYYGDIFDLLEDYIACESDIIPSPLVDIPEDKLKKYCGYYEFRSSRMKLMEFADILFSGRSILYENDTLYQQDFMSEKKPLIPVSENLFRNPDQPEASIAFVKTANGKMVYASRSAYYEKIAVWKPLVYQLLFFGALIIMASAIVYTLIWIPIHIYKMIRHKNNRSKYLRMRIIPLLAVITLILGIIALTNQSMLELGLKTVRNQIFYISTLIFALLSFLSVYFAIRSFHTPVNMIARIYAVLLSTACLGLTIYFHFWGLIGLRLWAY